MHPLPAEPGCRRLACAWMMRSLSARSRFNVSAARARAGSMLRVRSSHKAWRPAAD